MFGEEFTSGRGILFYVVDVSTVYFTDKEVLFVEDSNGVVEGELLVG